MEIFLDSNCNRLRASNRYVPKKSKSYPRELSNPLRNASTMDRYKYTIFITSSNDLLSLPTRALRMLNALARPFGSCLVIRNEGIGIDRLLQIP